MLDTLLATTELKKTQKKQLHQAKQQRKIAKNRKRVSPKGLDHYREVARLLSDTRLRDEVTQVLRTPVEVVVVATMSAGKSTLINALIGKELLPSGNEACTARIVRIEDHDGEEFKVRLVSVKNTPSEIKEASNDLLSWIPANPSDIASLNMSEKEGLIEIVGDIETIDNLGAHLVLYDTPGPNNSRDPKHAAMTKQIIEEGGYGLVIYVLNATQIGINDDQGLLNQLKQVNSEQNSKKKFIFVLNKADQLDEEKGESLTDIVSRVKDYLLKCNFVDPLIVPICAQGALLARKLIGGEQLSRREKGIFQSLFEEYQANATRYLKASRLPATIAKRIGREIRASSSQNKQDDSESVITIAGLKITIKQLKSFVSYTGVRAIELSLEQVLIEDGLPTTMKALESTLREKGLKKLAKWVRERDQTSKT